MTFGPTELHKCPYCKKLYLKRTLRSGNTIGARYYTDGKMIAPMQEEFPQITKCANCDAIFWLNNHIDENLGSDKEIEITYPGAVYARFLAPHEYQEALSLKMYRSISEETFLRMKLWYTFNDRIRDLPIDSSETTLINTIFINENDQFIYEENARNLIELLDKSEENRRISAAELNRNLGQFIDAIMLLDTVIDPKYQFTTAFLKKKCEESNKFTCIINV